MSSRRAAGSVRLDASAVSVIGLLNPVAGVALGTVLAGEHLAPLQWTGLLLVLGGVVLGQVRSPGRRAAASRGVRRVVACERAT